jgi:hypothetical protein
VLGMVASERVINRVLTLENLRNVRELRPLLQRA